MKAVGIRALKQNASAVVADVARGEPVAVTDRGRTVAQLLPVGMGRLAELVVAGLARPAKRSVADLDPMPSRKRAERPVSGALAEMRDTERY